MKTTTTAEPAGQEQREKGQSSRKKTAPNAQTQATPNTPADGQGVIRLPAGLLGFEKAKNYVLLGSQEEAPFLRLQMTEEPKLAFLAIEPARAVENYQPDLSDEDTQFLGLKTPEDALLFNIVTVHRDGTATVNLKGPIVINRQTLIGKQIIPINSADYSLQQPLEAMPAKACA